MQSFQTIQRKTRHGWRAALASLCLAVAACGGGGGGGSGGGGGAPAVAPALTLQPANLTVAAGLTASFSVAATGTAPLSYQWQRNGADIAGASAATYALAAAALADNGAVFRAVVSNAAGSVTSNPATLTVTPPAPVLTVTLQPANTSVVAGTAAAFTVAATCSSGTLGIQWQRMAPGGLTWADIAGATAATLSVPTTIADNGAQFRAVLDCSGASLTPSSAALLTVTAPPSVTLSVLPIVGLRDQAEIRSTAGIDEDPSGSFTFISRNRIKRLSADLTTITPVAGGIPVGAADGPAANATFNLPQGLTQDPSGNLYIADTDNHTIRKIAPDGTVSTLAGLAGASGSNDGTGSAARFNAPFGIARGPDGDLYVSDSLNHLIRRVTPAGVVSTYAGSTGGFTDGTPSVARFTQPRGVAVAANGEVFVADYGNLRVRRIARSGGGAGAVSTLAGNGTNTPAAPDGVGIAAGIAFPSAIVLRGNTLSVCDETALVRQIDITTGVVTTLTGLRTPPQGYADGPATTARLRFGTGITGAPGGGFMFSDDRSLRSVSATGTVLTIAASDVVGQGIPSSPSGIGTLTQIPLVMGPNTRQALTVDGAGNVIIADYATKLVRRISPSGAVSLVAGLAGSYLAALDGTGSGAQFVSIGPIVSDSAGVLHVTDNYSVRRIGTDNKVTTLAGSATEVGNNDGNASTARFYDLEGITLGPGSDVFVSDHNAIRRIDAAGNVTTYAGVTGQFGDIDGPVATARFQFPTTLTFGPDGSLYVADGGVIRRVAPDGLSVTRLALNDFTGGLAIDSAGTLYFGAVSGLKMLDSGGTSTLLVPKGPTVLGANPQLPNIYGVAILGPKQLLIQSGFGPLFKVTLP